MKRRLFSLIELLLNWVVMTLYTKPKCICALFSHKEYWSHASYFPEKKSKPQCRVFFEQLKYIIKDGAPNEYYFMYGLDVKGDKEVSEYVNYAPFMKRRDELNLKSIHNSTCLLRNKFYFGLIAEKLGISTPHIIAYIRNGHVYLVDVKTEMSLDDFVISGDYDMFCKVIDGECGKGIFALQIRSGKIFENGIEISLVHFRNDVSSATFICQEKVVQHHEMDRLYDKSVNTIRLVTIRSLKDGEIKTIPPILRIGANGSIVDNTSQGGIAVGFDISTGRLDEYGIYKPNYGLKTREHPNSHIVFSTFIIPFLKESIEMAIRFHTFFLDIHSIGWDIAITENGPVFIEGNDNWEINGHQDGNHGLKKECMEYFFNE